MNRTRFAYSNDPSLINANRAAAVARASSASVVLGIVAVAVLTACSPRLATGSRAQEAPSVTSTQSNDPTSSSKSIEPTWLEPAEVDEHSKYIYG